MYLHILYARQSLRVLSASVSLLNVNYLLNLKNVSWLQIASELSECVARCCHAFVSFSVPISITLSMMKRLTAVNINAKQYEVEYKYFITAP